MKRTSKSDSREKGQSLVEVAAGLVFLLILLAGVVDLGRALYTRVTLLDAAEEGAMYGAGIPSDTSGIESRIRDYTLGPIDFTDSDQVDISIDVVGSACAGNLLQVTVSHEMMITTPFLGTVLGSQTIPITGVAESVILAPGCP
jgi:Flp pilus assembly protein TadG